MVGSVLKIHTATILNDIEVNMETGICPICQTPRCGSNAPIGNERCARPKDHINECRSFDGMRGWYKPTDTPAQSIVKYLDGVNLKGFEAIDIIRKTLNRIR